MLVLLHTKKIFAVHPHVHDDTWDCDVKNDNAVGWKYGAYDNDYFEVVNDSENDNNDGTYFFTFQQKYGIQ